MLLLTTLCFHDKWENEFDCKNTRAGVFHASEGDLQTRYMRQSRWIDIFIEETFTAVPLTFQDWETMWIVLPREGLSPESLLREGFFKAFKPDWGRLVKRDVHMAIPKFDISQDMDIIEDLQAMGIRDVFSDDSQTPCMTVDGNSIKLDQVRHSAKLSIDEKGCKASAYTSMRGIAAGGLPQTPPRYDFIVDRPFLFVLTGKGNLPLFMGIVHQPESWRC